MISKTGCSQTSLVMIFIIILFGATSSLAGVIKIKTQTSVKTGGDQVEIYVVLTNEGTETAYDLQVQPMLLGASLESKLKPQLDPAESATFSFAQSIEGNRAGRHPLTILVNFHDANHYPFSALSGMTFSKGPDVNSDLAVIGQDIALEKSGKITFNIKNLGDGDKNILATLMLPRELSTATPQVKLLLPARSQKDLQFQVANFSALPGGGYPVFCYFEYDSKNSHHTSVCTAVIKVIEAENLFRQYRWLWLGLAGIFILALLALIIKSRIKA